MTLMASFREQGTPILIGDVLISAPGKDENNTPSPLRRDDHKPIVVEQEYRIAQSRKISLINSNLVVGWTDNKNTAQSIMRQVDDYFERNSVSLASLKLLLSRMPRKSGDCRAILVGWLVENGAAYSFGWDSELPSSFTTENPIFLGSGRDYFLDSIEKSVGLRHAGASHTVESALKSVLTLIGQLMMREALHGDPLTYRFGNGYEIAYFDGEEFQLLDDVVFLFMDFIIKSDETAECIMSDFALKQNYFDEQLVLCRKGIGDNSDWRIYVITDHRPFEGTLSRGKIDEFLSGADYFCASINVVVPDSGSTGMVFTTHGDKNADLRLSGHWKNGRISVSENFLQKLNRQVRKCIAPYKVGSNVYEFPNS